MMDHWLTPWRTSLAFSAAWLEASLAMQKSMMGIAMSQNASETDIRDAFRSAADANIRRWGMAASTLQAMPDWYHSAYVMPGNFMTDQFDKLQRGRRAL